MALDYIGKRGSTVGATRDKRVQYARDLLQKELLPHIGIEAFCETKKVGAGAQRTAAQRVSRRSVERGRGLGGRGPGGW